MRAGAERWALGLGERLATGILDRPKEENNLEEIKELGAESINEDSRLQETDKWKPVDGLEMIWLFLRIQPADGGVLAGGTGVDPHTPRACQEPNGTFMIKIKGLFRKPAAEKTDQPHLCRHNPHD